MSQSTSAFRNLLYHLVRRDLTVRYKSTVLGFFWSFIKPLALTGIFYLVFVKILNLQLKEERINFALHLLGGILAWTFFAGATGDALNAVLGNANLIKKVKLPLAVFPLAAVCSHLVHFLLGLLILVALLIVGGMPPGPLYVFIPLIVALHFLLTLAVALILSALNVFYRDVTSIWEVVTTAWFYGTPIIYPIYQATGKLQEMGWGWATWIFMLNPMTPLVLAYRRVMIYGSLKDPLLELADGRLLGALAIGIVITMFLLAIGWRVFSRYSKSFADEL